MKSFLIAASIACLATLGLSNTADAGNHYRTGYGSYYGGNSGYGSYYRGRGFGYPSYGRGFGRGFNSGLYGGRTYGTGAYYRGYSPGYGRGYDRGFGYGRGYGYGRGFNRGGFGLSTPGFGLYIR